MVDIELQTVQIGFYWFDVKKKVFNGFVLGDGVTFADVICVAVADSPDAGGTAVGGETESFELADDEE